MHVEFIGPYSEGPLLPLPLFLARVPAGFPSPADDYVDRVLDLNELVITNPPATYFVRAVGLSMVLAGIYDGDVLVVDRSVAPESGNVVVAALDGTFTVKTIRIERRKGGPITSIWLLPEAEGYPVVQVSEEMDFEIFGVVTYVLHALAKPSQRHERPDHYGNDRHTGDGWGGPMPQIGD